LPQKCSKSSALKGEPGSGKVEENVDVSEVIHLLQDRVRRTRLMVIKHGAGPGAADVPCLALSSEGAADKNTLQGVVVHTYNPSTEEVMKRRL
jgi:hypothetical protein